MTATTLDRLNAALEGRYHIERELGEGGMAKVYLAHDLKHERRVALKVLKPELAAVVGAERFLAEIKTTANLQHPHVLALFDSGEADSFLYYVMPYVEGETLRDRLDREKQLPVAEAVRIASAVAHALQHAHDRGVIHRDIKPGNILMQDGEPVVADFGIALAVGAAGGTRLTETGLSVGTPYYMSPEQATGDQALGPPADTYALAAVLYEMLTGEPPYGGSTAQAVLGRILQGVPVSATEVRSAVPPNVDAAIRRALERLPADRFARAQDFAEALADAGFRYGETAGVGGGAAAGRPFVTVGASVLAAGLGAALTFALTRPPPPPVVRFALDLPDEHAVPQYGSNVAISPDGSRLVYAGPGPGRGAGVHQLWLRARDRLDVTPIVGTEGRITPAFSPDGTRIAAMSPQDVQILSLTGAPPVTVVEGGAGFQGGGLAWGDDGYLYLDVQEGLARVPDTGGELEVFTRIDTVAGESSHNWPQVLPGGRGVLFTVWRAPITDLTVKDIAVADASGAHRVLLRGVHARYAPSGHLVYVTASGALMAAPFDLRALEVTGPSVALLEGVSIQVQGSVDLAMSDDGTLVYARGGIVETGGEFELVWVDRGGRAEPVDPGWTFSTDGNGNAFGWSLSPDGTRIALTEDTDAGRDIWIKRLPAGARTRLTFFEGEDRAPRWTPDGQRVTFVSERETDLEVWSRRWDATGEAELVFDYDGRIPEGYWAPGGEWFVFRTAGLDTENAEGSRDIGAIRPGVDTEPRALVATQYIEEGAEVSPDGRWLAYSSDETGRREVYVRPFPDVEAGKWPVSRDGGMRPRWAPSGQELFFYGGGADGAWEMMSAEVQASDAELRVGAIESLFRVGFDYIVFTVGDTYDVAPDAQRFLMGRLAQGAQDGESSGLVVVQGFFEELKQRVR